MKTVPKPSRALCGLTLSVLLLAPSLSHAQLEITTVAGTGVAGLTDDSIGNVDASTAPNFVRANGGMVVDAAGNLIFSDTRNHIIRKVTFGNPEDSSTGVISTIAGTTYFVGPILNLGYVGLDGVGTGDALGTVTATDFLGLATAFTGTAFESPQGLALDASGNNLYIADTGNNRVCRLDLGAQQVSNVVTGLPVPSDLELNGDTLYIDCDSIVYSFDLVSEVLTVVAGTGVKGYNGDGDAATALLDDGAFPGSSPDGGIALDTVRNILFIGDTGNNLIRAVDLSSGQISDYAGIQGTSTYSEDPAGNPNNTGIGIPEGIDVDGAGNLYISSPGNPRVLRVSAGGGFVSTVVGGTQASDPTANNGDGGDPLLAQLSSVSDVCWDAGLAFLYVRDQDRIRRTRIAPPQPPGISDVDGDGLTYDEEIALGTDPDNADSDSDGLNDGEEVNTWGTDPLDDDSDADGLDDGVEVMTQLTDPNNRDTDGDGLTDGEEVEVYNTFPNQPDTDGDKVDDGTEVAIGSDPRVSDLGDDVVCALLVNLADNIIGGLEPNADNFNIKRDKKGRSYKDAKKALSKRNKISSEVRKAKKELAKGDLDDASEKLDGKVRKYVGRYVRDPDAKAAILAEVDYINSLILCLMLTQPVDVDDDDDDDYDHHHYHDDDDDGGRRNHNDGDDDDD